MSYRILSRVLGALLLVIVVACGKNRVTRPPDDHDVDDVVPVNECPSGTYGADCSGVCACDADKACVEGHTGDGSCLTRLHDALVHAEHPFDVSTLTVDAATGRMTGVGVVAADEQQHVFAFADGNMAATPIVADVVRRLATADMAIVVDDGVLWRVDLTSLATTRLSGSEQVAGAWLSPDETLVVYVAQLAGETRSDLFLVDRDGNGGARLTTGGAGGQIVHEPYDFYGPYIVRPQVLADNSRVVFVVAQGVSWGLYAVTTAGTGLVKLSGAGSVGEGNSSTFAFKVAPGASRVIYVADDDTASTPELYAIDADGSGKVKLSGALAAGGAVVSGYRLFTADITGDGSHAIFIADRDGNGTHELYSVGLGGGAVATLSGPAEDVATDLWPRITSDGGRVVYYSDVLRVVALAGGSSTPLGSSDNPPAAYYELSPLITANDASVVYVASDAAGSAKLFVARLDGVDNREISGPAVADAGLYSSGVGEPYFYFVSGDRVVYRASEDGSYDYALYVVDLDGGNRRRLTPRLTHNFYLSSLFLGDYGGKGYFTADPTVWTRAELFSFDWASGQLVNVSDGMPQFVTEDIQAGSLAHDSSTLWGATTSYSFGPYEKDLIIADLATTTSCHPALAVTATSRVLTMPDTTAADSGSVYMRYTDGGSFHVYRAGASCQLSTIVDPPFDGAVKLTVDQQKLVYSAPDAGTTGLFSIAQSGANRVRISGDMVAGGALVSNNSGAFVIAPNGARVIYVADQEINDVYELYAVGLDGSSPAKLNPVLSGGGVYSNSMCFNFRITPDSQRALFTARTTGAGPMEIYSAKLDGSDLHKLSGTMTGPGMRDYACEALQLTPDGSRAVFRVAQDSSTRDDIYVASLDGTVRVKLSGQINATENTEAPFLTADGQYVVYRATLAHATTPTTYTSHLIASRIDGSGSVELAATAPGAYVNHFAVTRQGARVVFNVVENNRSLLYARNADGTGQVQLGGLVDGTEISRRPQMPFVPTADGRVVFVTDTRESDGSRTAAILVVSDSGGVATLISPAARGRQIDRIALSIDDARVLAVGDLARPGVAELFDYAL